MYSNMDSTIFTVCCHVYWHTNMCDMYMYMYVQYSAVHVYIHVWSIAVLYCSTEAFVLELISTNHH